jgi:flagellar hook assembly protein FlgD
VVEPVAVSHLANVRVFPNPYKPGSGTSFDRAGGMMFSNLTADAKIQVYAVTGELVFEGEETDGDGRYEWPAVNSSGEKVASGVYVFRITNSAGEKKMGKLAVIR